MNRHVTAVFVLALGSLLPSPAAAQPPATSPATTPSPASQTAAASQSTPVVAGWQNGFFVQSADGDYRLQLGTVVQLDGRFSVDPLDDVKPIVNTFTIRKARVVLSGRAARYFDFRIMPDFGSGTATLLDASFDIRFSKAFRLRFGKDKSPVGYEVLVSDAALVFPERAFPSSLLPSRDIGLQAQGDLAGGKVFYAGGVMNGIVDGTNSSVDVDTNNGKDLVGRVVFQPFRRTTGPGALSGFGVQIGGSSGKQTGALPSFRTSIGQTWFSYAGANGTRPAATADGQRTRITPAFSYYYKTAGIFGEYARSTQAVTRGAETRDIRNTAWDVTGIINLTGETASAGLVTPAKAFDPPTRKWGALQAAVRYAELDVDDDAFEAGFAAAGASRRAQQFTAGVNWYLVQYVKFYVNYEQTVFDKHAEGSRPTEHAIYLRMQLAF